MLNYQNEEYITLDELKETVPSIFTKNGGPTTSEKYTHIPTDKVIKDMELLGWKVADAKEVAARTSDTKTFQKCRPERLCIRLGAPEGPQGSPRGSKLSQNPLFGLQK